MARRRWNLGRKIGTVGAPRRTRRGWAAAGLLLVLAASWAAALHAGVPAALRLAEAVSPSAGAQSVPPPSSPSKEYVYAGGRLVATEEPFSDAAFVSQSVTASMVTGQTYSVSVTMSNTGTTTWTPAANYRLGSQNPQDNSTWGMNRVNLASEVAPGAQATFTFTVTAPATPGTYNFQWRMVQDGVAWFGASTVNVAVTVSQPASGSLSVNFAAQTAPVNLTSEGTLDWAHWGLNGAPSFDHKAGVTQQISDYSMIGSAAAGSFGDLAYAHSWTDGAPTTSATATTGVYVSGAAGNGFRITAPADTTTRTLKLYVGAWDAQGQLQVQLSDGSAATYTDTLASSSSGTTNYVYAISYKAASAGQTVTVSYTILNNYNGTLGNVTLQAATLMAGTPPYPPANAADFVSQSVPTSMLAGQPYNVSVTMRNTGVNGWSGTATSGYRLGSQNPQDNTTWGTNRVPLPTYILPGAQATFNFTVTAPATPGTYNFQWRMISEGMGSDGPFGAYSVNVAVTVSAPASNGSLTGAVTGVSSGGIVNLTTEGTQDWANWGLTSAASFDHKAGVAQQISNYSVLGVSAVSNFGDLTYTHTWTDGQPDASGSATTGVYVSGAAGNGFQVTAPADTATRTLKLYVGAWNAQGQLQAQLSDGSAATYVDTSVNATSGTLNYVYTISYKAASAGQTLTVSFTLLSNYNSPYGNVTLQAATLAGAASAGAPPTNLVATASTINPPSATVTVTWSAPSSGTPTSYVVERAGLAGQFQQVGQPVAAPTTNFSDTTASEGAAYLYRVKAVFSGGGTSDYSNTDLATAVAFSDDPLIGAGDPQGRPATVIKAAHLNELRRAVSAVHALAGLGAVTTWTYPNPVSSPPEQRRGIYLDDVQNLRDRLGEALAALGISAPAYRDPVLARGMAVKKEHFQQLRDAVK
jgi:Ig-like domain from next to BRCA1 gene